MPADDVLTRAEAKQRAALLADVTYDVALDLTVADDRFGSTSTMRFTCREPGAVTFIDLDPTAEVASVVVNGDDLPVSVARQGGRIVLPALQERNEVRVAASCRYQTTGIGLHRFVDPVDRRPYLHTQFEPWDAHRVFACADQPDVKAEFALEVTAPPEWVCVSNAPAVEEADVLTGGTWRFARTKPISTYLTALVAGPYHRFSYSHGDVDLGVWCRRSLAKHLDPDEIIEITRQGFDFFTERFDQPYPFEKYDQLFVPEFSSGAMENAGCVTFSETYVFRSKVTEAARQSRANTILHELAHMWFGDLVTMRWWDDLWLNESFATYMAYHALVEATRFRDSWAAFQTQMKAWAYAQDQLPSTHPIVADITDTDGVRLHFDGITYAKGASVLRQLVAWVGEDAFLTGLRDYFRRHAWGNATLADFLAPLEEASGRNLGDWSKEWLETAGVATLRPELVVDDDRLASVCLVQEATAEHPSLRSHRVGVGLFAHDEQGDLVRTERIELDAAGARTDVGALAGVAAPDLLLVNDGDLAYAKIRFDKRSLATLERSLGRLQDALARALCWGGLWDMLRDAELAARRYAAIVADHAAAETDLAVLQTLLRQAEAAVDRFGDPPHRTIGRARLAERARAQLDAAEPASDEQLVWVRALATVGDDEEHRALIRGLLNGTTVVGGLAVDTELRWHLLTALAAAGQVADAAIDAELGRDATDMGARRAATARAAVPTAEAKQRAWDLLLRDRSLPLAMQRAVAAGLWQYGQDDLAGPYADRWVDALEAIWAERTPEEAMALTAGLYPMTLVSDRLVAAADRALALDGVPAHGRRLVAEQRDATQRALRARAVDRDE